MIRAKLKPVKTESDLSTIIQSAGFNNYVQRVNRLSHSCTRPEVVDFIVKCSQERHYSALSYTWSLALRKKSKDEPLDIDSIHCWDLFILPEDYTQNLWLCDAEFGPFSVDVAEVTNVKNKKFQQNLSDFLETFVIKLAKSDPYTQIVLPGLIASQTQEFGLTGLYFPNSRIWIDALCINQQDNKEKEHQVLLMGEIYSNASETIVWLEKETPDLKKFIWMHQKLWRGIVDSMNEKFENDEHGWLEFLSKQDHLDVDFWKSAGFPIPDSESSNLQDSIQSYWEAYLNFYFSYE